MNDLRVDMQTHLLQYSASVLHTVMSGNVGCSDNIPVTSSNS